MRHGVGYDLQILSPEHDQAKAQQRQREKDAQHAGSSSQYTLPGAQRPRLRPGGRREKGSGPQGADLTADLAAFVSNSSSQCEHITTDHPAGMNYYISSDRHQIPGQMTVDVGGSIQDEKMSASSFRGAQAEVPPTSPASGNGDPELTAGLVQRGTEPIFDQSWLAEIAEIHRGSPGGDLLRANLRLRLVPAFGLSKPGDQPEHVIYQIGCATGDAIHRDFGTERVTPGEGEKRQDPEKALIGRHGPPAGSGQPGGDATRSTRSDRRMIPGQRTGPAVPDCPRAI